MRPKYLILGGLLLIAAALSLTAYNLWEDQRATAAAQQALAERSMQDAEEAAALSGELFNSPAV